MTVQIALCDDETTELNKTEKLLSAYEKKLPDLEFVIQCFEDAGKLLAMAKDDNYSPDLVFMDIYMSGEQGQNIPLGIEAAKKLRNIGSKAKLFFLTASEEYALEAFNVEASGYLVKPISEDKLFPKLNVLLEGTGLDRRKCILLKRAEKIIKVPLNDVVYCEGQRKRQCIYMADGTKLLQNLTMAKIYDLCSVYQKFVRVGSSYIVNLEHIESLNTQEASLDNGQKIYLPRGTYRCLREQYLEYYCGKD